MAHMDARENGPTGQARPESAASTSAPAPRPRMTLGEIADAHGLREVTDHPTWRDIVVTSVRQDNRSVIGGTLFVALPGEHTHGARFASDALARGAVAVLTDEAGVDELIARIVDAPARLGPDAPFLVPENGQEITGLLGALAAQVLDDPAGRLSAFGVTGTNGKTTIAYMIDHVLGALGRTTGLITTVEVRVGGAARPAVLTTPQPTDLQHLLAEFVDAGATHMTMEASSHALVQGRVDGMTFAVAGFSNLTQDHLDFHGTLEEYFAAKKRIFAPEHSHRGVVLVDDSWGRRMYREVAEERPGRIVPLAVALSEAGDSGDGSDDGERAVLDAVTREGWWVSDVAVETPQGATPRTAFTLRHADGRDVRTWTTLPGDFNLANAALALAMVLEAGAPSLLEASHIEEALAAHDGVSPAVPGRMEIVSDPAQGEGPRVIVDFAHNTGALESALAALRPSTNGALRVVFGAAGERDTGKRPHMGRAAVLGADDVVITDDDPHAEDPAEIRAQVLAGAREALETLEPAPAEGESRATQVREIAPRELAIETVIAEAEPGDTVLVAGRGHETVQDFAGIVHAVDDRVVAREALARRTPHPRSTSA